MSLLVEMPLVKAALESTVLFVEERSMLTRATPPGMSLLDEYAADLKDIESNRHSDSPIMPTLSIAKRKATQGGAKQKPTEVVKWDSKKSSESSSSFSKTKPTPAVTEPSLLSSLFVGQSSTTNNPALAEIPAGKSVAVRVFLACVPGQPPLKMTLSDEASVDQVIKVALAQYELEGRKPPMERNTRFYQLRLTDDDDGTPDEDLPALERSQVLKKVCCEDFALCDNPKAEEEIAEYRKQRLTQGLPDDAAITSDEDQLSPLAGRIDAEGNITLKVNLPSGGSSRVKVHVDILVKDLLQIISTRRSLPVNGLTVMLKDPPIAVDVNRTVRSLGVDEIVLKRGRRESASPGGRDITPLGLPDTPTGKRARSNSNLSVGSVDVDTAFMFSDFSAIKYQEWQVTKINRSNKRQLRILGIDDERIHNMQPEGEATGKLGFLKKGIKTVKKAYRMLDEVSGVTFSQGSPRFTIDFKDGPSNYEAASPHDAAEICAKVNFLLNMRNMGSQGAS